MALSDRYRKERAAIQNERERLAVERATSSVKRLMETDQFKLSALALPENDMAIDAIVRSTVDACLDPVAMFIDTLRAKGFRQAEIRAVVPNLYRVFFIGVDEAAIASMTYEDMLKPVAEHAAAHQEVFNTLDPANLRD